MRAIVLILFFASVTCTWAQENVFDKAEQLYKQNKYSEALQEYQLLEKQQYAGKELFYNMGNCYYKLNMPGMSIAYYEKALKHDPADEDIRANLRLVNSKTEDKINEEKKGLSAWFNRFIHELPADKWSKLGLGLWLIGFLGLVMFKLQLLRKRALTSFFSWFCLVVGFMSLLVGYLNYRAVNGHNTAVITSAMVQVRASPSESAKNLYILHEGAKVNLHEMSDAWYEISIDNENYGWVKKEEAVVI